MKDYFEIDFLDVGSTKSGDAIPIRYCLNDVIRIHLVDGGYQETGKTVAEKINLYYNSPHRIDSVVVTHPDGDHAGGLRTVLEEFEIGELWMLRPWLYAEHLLDRFQRFTSAENLQKRLREIYPNIAALEEIAEDKNIPILAPFQGSVVGSFSVMAPTPKRYLDLIVESERTPESAEAKEASTADQIGTILGRVAIKAINFIGSIRVSQ